MQKKKNISIQANASSSSTSLTKQPTFNNITHTNHKNSNDSSILIHQPTTLTAKITKINSQNTGKSLTPSSPLGLPAEGYGHRCRRQILRVSRSRSRWGRVLLPMLTVGQCGRRRWRERSLAQFLEVSVPIIYYSYWFF